MIELLLYALKRAEAKRGSASSAPPQGLEPWTYGLTDYIRRNNIVSMPK
ncbi:MAG: hypothetical protein HKN09_04555 [Saprospiraceae bacterium]|nr:hypothetical protein [Saprospiraceae bacterium]